MAEPLVVLAPLAEVTDAAFRAVAFDAGADAATTEMVSAAGLVRGSRNTPPLLERLPEERGRPLSAQLYGHDPAELAEAARIVAGLGRFAAVDLNAGCPMRRIVANGDGAALMRDPALLGRCVAAMARAAAPLPVTVKTRIGTDPEHPAAAELARACADAGASLLAGASVEDHGAAFARALQIALDGPGRGQRARPQQIVPAAVAAAPRDKGLRLGQAGRLAQAGQGVELAQDADHRPSAAVAAAEGGVDAAQLFLHREAQRAQRFAVQLRRTEFLEAQLGIFPDLVGKLFKNFRIGVDGGKRRIFLLVHAFSPLSRKKDRLKTHSALSS